FFIIICQSKHADAATPRSPMENSLQLVWSKRPPTSCSFPSLQYATKPIQLMAGSIDPVVKEAAKKAAQYEPVYITEHSVPRDFDFPDNFRVDKIPGMLFYQVIDKSAHERRVITWWRSCEASVEAWKKQFAQLLGARGALCFE